MNVEYKDFIGFFTDMFPEGFCEHMVSEFERLDAMGAGRSRQDDGGSNKLAKDDIQIFNGNIQTYFFLDCKNVFWPIVKNMQV